MTTLLLVGRLLNGAEDNLCRVRNISAGGMQIETLAPIEPAQTLHIELVNLSVVTATVMWTDRPRAGLSFDRPIEVARFIGMGAICNEPGPSRMPRMPRVKTNCSALLRYAGRVSTGVLEDISQRGARIRIAPRSLFGNCSASPGDLMKVSVAGIAPRHGAIRWIKGNEIGIVFFEMLAFAELTQWLAGPHRFARDGLVAAA